MNRLNEKKQRYLRDPLQIRLGGLAANLARVRSFSKNPANGDAVYGLFEESKYFIEWTAAETEVETAQNLVDIQLQISRWQRNWQEQWDAEISRVEMAEISARWSRNILETSGLI